MYITMAMLSFGWSHSPFIFTKVMRVLTGAQATHTGSVTPSIPQQFPHPLQGPQHGPARDRGISETLLFNLGLKRNENNAMWEPAQVMDHPGLRVD